ncbi:MAG: dienelactone hydrolase family protein [Thiohalophilus sp.]|uniref:dienelactone hydrolase family protein n=1 Tax=Thiohalophilus sp. TaxID=3028392 RepID=UPI0028702AB0|nr:dienelactone hydrolase family protein [Thiohalophilus sp.]MDR9435596.1 dienelactone hydrolase family protein [Thiohalophilus sp.]
MALVQTVGAHDESGIAKELWWSEAWWNEGLIEAPRNYDVEVEEYSYESNGVTIPAMLARPKQAGKFPAVLFQHGRRGLDELIRRHVKRLAARGFVVLAPDIYQAHFIGTHPIEHDYELEADVNRGVDALLSREDISSDRICLYSHTRGGYYTLKVATTFARQKSEVACYVSYYPHLQDPNAPEPLQVYGFAEEVDQLEIPVLVFIGEDEQYQRRRVIESSVESLQKDGKPARLIVYPGVGRGFDFRPESVRTFADDLASKDAIQRAADFMRRHLGTD